MHSLRYVINAPAPPRVAPDNGGELLVDICINIMVLMVLGTAVSKISSAPSLTDFFVALMVRSDRVSVAVPFAHRAESLGHRWRSRVKLLYVPGSGLDM